MEDQTSASPSGCCNHYPNRVLRKRDLALEIGVCEKTIGNLHDAGKLPEPCWFNSIPVWMLDDVHAFISTASRTCTSARDAESSQETTAPADAKETKKAKKTAHTAGKYSV